MKYIKKLIKSWNRWDTATMLLIIFLNLSVYPLPLWRIFLADAFFVVGGLVKLWDGLQHGAKSSTRIDWAHVGMIIHGWRKWTPSQRKYELNLLEELVKLNK